MMDGDNVEDVVEFNMLSTRAITYKIKVVQCPATESVSNSAKKATRFQYFLACINHHDKGKTWTTANDKYPECMVFEPSPLPNGKLPTLHSIICYRFYLRSSIDCDHKPVDHYLTLDVMNHWIKCNVYTKTRKRVQEQLQEHFAKFKYLRDYPKKKKKATYWNKYNIFIANCKKLFNIIAEPCRIQAQEKVWGVKMKEIDKQFHKNMCAVPQIGYCSNVNEKWK
jgi:hypothetical protein